MERLKQVFLDRGITVADLPKAIVIHELLGAAMAIGFWTACYGTQPSKTFARPIARQLSRNAFLSKSYQQALLQAERRTLKMRWLHRTGADPARLTVSLAESLCLRASIKPVTFPFKIWATWKAILFQKHLGEQARIAV